MQESLLDADRRKDEFLAALAHELRTPLASIYNAALLLRNNRESGGYLLDVVVRQTNHLVRLVDDLLDISRIALDKIQLQRKNVSLGVIALRAADACRHLIDAKNQRISMNVQNDALVVFGDPVRLTQIIVNLLSNSARYTPAGGAIEVNVTSEEDVVCVSVRDNGAGIPAAALQNIFDPFSNSRGRSDAEGLGLGLSLVRKLVSLHGGHVEAHSEGAGKGSVFVVRLPRVHEQPAPAQDDPPLAVSPLRKQANNRLLRVLVIEDDDDLANVFAMALTGLGATARVVGDGPSGIAIIEGFKPDVIFLDIGLPGIDGYETARRIRVKTCGHPITLVALTGWGQEKDRRRAKEAGFDLHLTKPASLEAIREVLERVRNEPS